MNIFTIVGNAIWEKLEPKIDERLDRVEALAKQQLDEWRDDSMAMLKEVLPDMAGAIADQAIKTTFKHTQVDEAANAVSGIISDIVDRIRVPFLRSR